MKKYLYLFYILPLFLLLTCSKDDDVNPTKEPNYAGSAVSLPGKSYVLTVFVSENEWDEAEKQALFKQVLQAQEWLKSEAGRYGHAVSFENNTIGLTDDPIMLDSIPLGTGTIYKEIVSTAVQRMGHSTNVKFVDWVTANTSSDNCVVLIIANTSGRAFAIPFNQYLVKETYYLESSIVYKKYENGSNVFSSTIAHELLHLYGAKDLYNVDGFHQEQEDKARELFPNDIMLRTNSKLSDLVIDPLTAWRIGLSDHVEEWYDWFNY